MNPYADVSLSKTTNTKLLSVQYLQKCACCKLHWDIRQVYKCARELQTVFDIYQMLCSSVFFFFFSNSKYTMTQSPVTLLGAFLELHVDTVIQKVQQQINGFKHLGEDDFPKPQTEHQNGQG